MLVKNENMKLVDIATYSNEILAEGLGQSNVTEQDAKDALAELYLAYIQEQPNMFLVNKIEPFTVLTIESIDKKSLWEKLREIFCSIVREDSTFSKIIDFILEAIGQIIPLGVFIKALVKVIIKFFLQWGIGRACPV